MSGFFIFLLMIGHFQLSWCRLTVLDNFCSLTDQCIVDFTSKGLYTFSKNHPLLQRLEIRPRFVGSLLNISLLTNITLIDMSSVGDEDPCHMLVCGDRPLTVLSFGNRPRICCDKQIHVTTEQPDVASSQPTTEHEFHVTTEQPDVASSQPTTEHELHVTTEQPDVASSQPTTERHEFRPRPEHLGVSSQPTTTTTHPPDTPSTLTTPLETAVISLGVGVVIVLIALVMLLIFHRQKLLKIKRLRLPGLSVSLTSASPLRTSTPLRRSASDPSLNYSQIKSTSPDPILPPHRYPTRYQKRQLEV